MTRRPAPPPELELPWEKHLDGSASERPSSTPAAPPMDPVQVPFTERDVALLEAAIAKMTPARAHLSAEVLLELAKEEARQAERAKALDVEGAEPIRYLRCTFCKEQVRIEGSRLAHHTPRQWQMRGRDKECPKSGSPAPKGPVSTSTVLHFMAGVIKADFFDWAFRLYVLWKSPRIQYGRHAVIKDLDGVADVWEAAYERLSWQDRAWWEREGTTLAANRTRMQACTSLAMWAPICWVGGCNDKPLQANGNRGTENRGNDWGRLDDAVPFDRGVRSWCDHVPRRRRLAVGGDRAGTFTGRWSRDAHRKALEAEWAVRKMNTIELALKDWRTGKMHRNRFVKSRQYLSCASLREALQVPQMRRMAAAIRAVACEKPTVPQGEATTFDPSSFPADHKPANPHVWLWLATQEARESRPAGIVYEDQIVDEHDRKAWQQHRLRSARYGELLQKRARLRGESIAPSEQVTTPLRGRLKTTNRTLAHRSRRSVGASLSRSGASGPGPPDGS